MKIEFYCPRWGSENISWDVFCKKVKDAGYDGVEYAIDRTVKEKELDEIWNLLAKQELKIIAQHYDTNESDFRAHHRNYRTWLDKINPYPVEKINSQTGKDYFGKLLNEELIAESGRARPHKRKIVHETHRNKFSYAAHVTKEYIIRNPEMRITLDASHWVCVAESYLEDQQEAVDLAISRTDHIHARVGHAEGPQVPDPRTAEWNDALNKHLQWWDQVVAHKQKSGETLTITPEFGPYPYMINVPRTGEPIADQWAINLWMMELLRSRYCLRMK